MTGSLEAFASAPSVSPLYVANGNTPWAQRYAQELREVVLRYAARLPRNTQRQLGPSELGYHCDRQLVGKMAGIEFHGGGNRLHDAWPSIVGTALHAFMEQAFTWESQWNANGRWLTECKVTPDPGALSPHPGTADLFDTLYSVLGDHKMQSEAIRARLRRDGPPYHYYIQMLLYALGYMHKGYSVQRVVLISWPRTKSSLDDMYVWEKVITAGDMREVESVLGKTVAREKLAGWVTSGEMSFWDVPPTPSEDDCRYCPFFNPAALADRTGQGCPGTSLKRVVL
jgi:hypothetical protein